MHGLIVALALSQTPKLPLTSLVLYENGLGYFERRGNLTEGASAEIPLEPGQLDDTLKSLVVVSAHGVASVEFAPPLAVEAARAMAGLPEKDHEASLEQLLGALQGVEVIATREGGPSLKGRVLQVTREPGLVDKEGKEHEDQTLLLFGDAGLAKVKLQQLIAVRPTSSAVSLAWTRAVGSSALQPERERLVVRGASGGGPVAVGYTTEAPVWRTTYRLVLGRAARLQGFALVHNDSDEPWSRVKVSLASGRPTSFLFPLAGPRYGRRDLVAPEDGLDTSPQLSTREAREHLRGSLIGSAEGHIALGGIGTGGGGYGVATGHGTVGSHAANGLSSTVLDDGPTPLEPAATSEAGNLFLYTVKEPVVLGARKSALLPIIDGPTTAEPVTLVDREGAAFTAVRFQNTTALTLEGGTLAVFTDGAYTGETQLDRVKPNEVRVLKHGVDLDLEVARTSTRAEGTLRRARVSGVAGQRVLELTRVDTLTHTLGFTSRTDRPRTVLVELPEAGYRVTRGAEEDVRSPNQPRFARLTVAPHAHDEVKVAEEGAVVERITADSLTSARLTSLLASSMPPEARVVLLAAKADVERAEQAQARLEALDRRVQALTADLARVRDDLGAAGKGGASGAAQKLGERLLALEDELARAQKEREAISSTATQARQRLVLASAT